MHSGSSPKSPLRAQNTSPRRGFYSYLFSMTKFLVLFLRLSTNPLQKKLISTACICDLILSFTVLPRACEHSCTFAFTLSSLFTTTDRHSIHFTAKTPPICLPISFSSLLSLVNKPQDIESPPLGAAVCAQEGVGVPTNSHSASDLMHKYEQNW